MTCVAGSAWAHHLSLGRDGLMGNPLMYLHLIQGDIQIGEDQIVEHQHQPSGPY